MSNSTPKPLSLAEIENLKKKRDELDAQIAAGRQAALDAEKKLNEERTVKAQGLVTDFRKKLSKALGLDEEIPEDSFATYIKQTIKGTVLIKPVVIAGTRKRLNAEENQKLHAMLVERQAALKAGQPAKQPSEIAAEMGCSAVTVTNRVTEWQLGRDHDAYSAATHPAPVEKSEEAPAGAAATA